MAARGVLKSLCRHCRPEPGDNGFGIVELIKMHNLLFHRFGGIDTQVITVVCPRHGGVLQTTSDACRKETACPTELPLEPLSFRLNHLELLSLQARRSTFHFHQEYRGDKTGKRLNESRPNSFRHFPSFTVH